MLKLPASVSSSRLTSPIDMSVSPAIDTFISSCIDSLFPPYRTICTSERLYIEPDLWDTDEFSITIDPPPLLSDIPAMDLPMTDAMSISDSPSITYIPVEDSLSSTITIVSSRPFLRLSSYVLRLLLIGAPKLPNSLAFIPPALSRTCFCLSF